MGEFVRLEVADGIGTIRLDRPKVNVFDRALLHELHEVALEATHAKEVRAVIVYGGERVFAAGADIKELAANTYTDAVDHSRQEQETLNAVAAIPKPTISAISRYALGSGCELALCTDFRVCGTNAQIGLPEINLGIIPGGGGTQRLARLVGPAKAKDIIFNARNVGAEEALAIGLVDRVVEPEEVYATAVSMATKFVNGPAYALRAAKEAIDKGLEVDLATGLEIERQQFVGLFATQDRTRGMQSFIDDGPGKATFVGA